MKTNKLLYLKCLAINLDKLISDQTAPKNSKFPSNNEIWKNLLIYNFILLPLDEEILRNNFREGDCETNIYLKNSILILGREYSVVLRQFLANKYLKRSFVFSEALKCGKLAFS